MSIPDWIACAGTFGHIAIAAGLVAVVGGIVLLVVLPRTEAPMRRFAAWLVPLVMPFVIGSIGSVVEIVSRMWMSSQVTETLKAPTPKDLAGGVATELGCLVAGAVCSIPGLVLLPFVLGRARSADDALQAARSTPAAASAAPPRR